ncbi:unnamed protein product [Eretmochelys imbricata]
MDSNLSFFQVSLGVERLSLEQAEDKMERSPRGLNRLSLVGGHPSSPPCRIQLQNGVLESHGPVTCPGTTQNLQAINAGSADNELLGCHSLRSSGVLGNEPGRMNEESESAKDQVIIISSNLGYSRGIHIQRQRRRANVTQASSEGIRSKPQKMDWNQQLSRTITLEKGRWDCADQ